MSTTLQRRHTTLLNKVPEVTVYFWIIKILCTTVGESFADYVNETLGFGLTNTTMFLVALTSILWRSSALRDTSRGLLARPSFSSASSAPC